MSSHLLFEPSRPRQEQLCCFHFKNFHLNLRYLEHQSLTFPDMQLALMASELLCNFHLACKALNVAVIVPLIEQQLSRVVTTASTFGGSAASKHTHLII